MYQLLTIILIFRFIAPLAPRESATPGTAPAGSGGVPKRFPRALAAARAAVVRSEMAHVRLQPTVNADLTRGDPWHPQPAKRILVQLEGEVRP